MVASPKQALADLVAQLTDEEVAVTLAYARRQQDLVDMLKRVTIYYADVALCRAWAEIKVRVERKGRPIAPADLWVAAPAG